MTGGRTAPRLAAVVVTALLYGIGLAGTAHTQGQDDLTRLLAEVGQLHSLGKYAEAAPIAERAVALARERYGEDRAEFASTIAWLAFVYKSQGRYAEAQSLYERTVAVYEKALGRGHPHVGTALNNLAELYVAQGRYPNAEPLHKRALGIREKALGPEHPSLAQSLNNLAELYRVSGQYAEAEPLYKRSLAIWEKTLGSEHPEVGTALSNLATLYQHQGRYAEAEPLYKRSLAIREKKLGPEHPDVAQTLNNLAALYESQGRYAEAELLYKRSLAIRETTLGPEHPSLGTSLNNLAILYRSQGRYDEAEVLFKRSLVIREKKLGAEHPDVAQTLNNLAVLYENQARYSEAETLHRRSLAIREKALGPEHPDVAFSLNNLAELFRTQARTAEAAALYRRSLAIWEKTLRTDHSLVATALNNLALLYSSEHRFAEAEPLYLRSLVITEKALGPNHPLVATPLNNLAALYKDTGRVAEAEPLYRRSLANIEKALGPEHYQVGQSLNNLALLYSSEHRFAEAEPLYRRSLTISEKALGSNHPQVGTVLSNLAGLAYDQTDWRLAADYWERSTGIIKRRAERALADNRGEASVGEAPRLAWQFRGLVKTTHRLPGSALRPSGMTAEMFEAAQWAQGSEVAASLSQMAVRSAKGSSQLAEVVRERQDLVSEWQAKDKLFIASKSELPAKRKPEVEKALANRLAAIDTRLSYIDKRLAQDFPDYAALASPAPVSLNEVQAQLGDDEALVLFLDTPEWRLLPEETFVWVVTKSDVRWVRSGVGTAGLAREVSALRCGLDASAWKDDAREKCAKALGIPLDNVPAPDQPLPFDPARAHKLYAALFSQVQDLIKGKHLLIVPSGPLTQLPFQVLVTKPPTSGDHRAISWLAREHAVTILPAVSSLKALRRIGRPSSAPRPMIGFGNPLLDGPDARYANRAKLAREHERCSDGRSQRMAVLAGPRGSAVGVETRSGLADVSHIKMQVPLPETAEELCAVAQDVKADARDIHLGAQATEHQIKQLSASGELAKYRKLHFATHGVLAGQLDGTHEPGLILTPPDEATEDDDGYLSASEIAALKLDADWVILSACNTAAGAATSAEALSGLARAFIYAQARALLVSHWEVYSDATVKLITGAIRKMARDPKVGRAEALRRSMLALIDKGEPHEAHPAYWAPFVVVGEGGAVNAGVPNNVASPASKIVRKPVRETKDRATDLLRPN